MEAAWSSETLISYINYTESRPRRPRLWIFIAVKTSDFICRLFSFICWLHAPILSHNASFLFSILVVIQSFMEEYVIVYWCLHYSHSRGSSFFFSTPEHVKFIQGVDIKQRGCARSSCLTLTVDHHSKYISVTVSLEPHHTPLRWRGIQ